MERRLTEEKITKAILNWLESNNWKIICFDFPQSGTGFVLHPNNRNTDSKNKNSVIPDIVAIKDNNVVFFENKDRFVLSDFEKIKKIKTSNDYSESISKLLSQQNYKNIYYGIGLPDNKSTLKKIQKYINEVDFVIQTNGETIKVTNQVQKIFK